MPSRPDIKIVGIDVGACRVMSSNARPFWLVLQTAAGTHECACRARVCVCVSACVRVCTVLTVSSVSIESHLAPHSPVCSHDRVTVIYKVGDDLRQVGTQKGVTLGDAGLVP